MHVHQFGKFQLSNYIYLEISVISAPPPHAYTPCRPWLNPGDATTLTGASNVYTIARILRIVTDVIISQAVSAIDELLVYRPIHILRVLRLT